MKPDFIDSKLIYTREKIAELNLEGDALSRSLLPKARELVWNALLQARFDGTEKVIDGKTVAILRDILTNWRNAKVGSPKVETEALARAVAANPAILFDEEWIEMTSADLARAVASFWLDLGDTKEALNERQTQLIHQMATDGDDDALAEFDLLASRYYVGTEARGLLMYLHTGFNIDYAHHEAIAVDVAEYAAARDVNTP